METLSTSPSIPWPVWKKIVFRFFFVYLALQIAPWTWELIPGQSVVTQYYDQFMGWLVGIANANLFHIRDKLVPVNGSGDTSAGWALFWLYPLLALVGCVLWSILDRKRKDYRELNYWLCLVCRYYIVMFAFIYGFAKIFLRQMSFPNMHELATPLGDFLPMRFSWIFIGYSQPYQIFSGIMEAMVGALLLYRRTATFGILLATGVFLNVFMLNLCYDIPVKIFSGQIVFVCLFLLVNESDRILCFFVLNRAVNPCNLYHFRYDKKWMRITRIVLKSWIILIFVVASGFNYLSPFNKKPALPKESIRNGFYEVAMFTVNEKPVPHLPGDTLVWRDAIFQNGLGSIKSGDTIFQQRYKRGYFWYRENAKNELEFRKFRADSLPMMTFRVEFPDTTTVRLKGREYNDSIYIELKKVNRQFKLTERQFHWLSESNR